MIFSMERTLDLTCSCYNCSINLFIGTRSPNTGFLIVMLSGNEDKQKSV